MVARESRAVSAVAPPGPPRRDHRQGPPLDCWLFSNGRPTMATGGVGGFRRRMRAYTSRFRQPPRLVNVVVSWTNQNGGGANFCQMGSTPSTHHCNAQAGAGRYRRARTHPRTHASHVKLVKHS